MERTSNRAERLLQLEATLLASSQGQTATELAERLHVHRSTIYRDIESLRKRVPIEEHNKRYSIDRSRYLTHIRLTPGESLMLYLTMRINIRRLTHVPSAMVSAMEKLTVALKHPITDQLAESLVNMREQSEPHSGTAPVWDSLLRAWFEQITVRFSYKKFQATHPTDYELQPYLFEPAVLSEGIYVIGYSLTHGEIRTFKTERILRATLTTQRFERPSNLTADTLLKHSWGIWYGAPLHEVQLRFVDPVVASRVRETRWHPSQIIEDLPNGGLIWKVQVSGVKELIPWIRGWGPACEVLSPGHLREQIAREMREAAQLYD